MATRNSLLMSAAFVLMLVMIATPVPAQDIELGIPASIAADHLKEVFGIEHPDYSRMYNINTGLAYATVNGITRFVVVTPDGEFGYRWGAYTLGKGKIERVDGGFENQVEL